MIHRHQHNMKNLEEIVMRFADVKAIMAERAYNKSSTAKQHD